MFANRLSLTGVIALLLVINCHAETNDATDKSRFDPQQVFAPLTLPQPVNRYRGADGAPGPDYWQNQADYEIHATLRPESKELDAEETITYTNNSPTALPALWLQMDQNVYRSDARMRHALDEEPTEFTAGFELDEVEVEYGGTRSRADYVVDDTRMQIRLASPVAAGDSVRLYIRYHYTIPGEFGGRTAWGTTEAGEIYDIAQWYPRMAVYDDLHGWDTQPYLGSEFYLEYGTFDYYITVPWDMLVAGSGELQNPGDVLTATQRARLEKAHNSDKTIMIRSADEIGDPRSRPTDSGTLTWHYCMTDTRDIAFSASRAFVWDAAAIRLPDDKRALAMSYYPPADITNESWSRSTEYMKHAVEEFSRRWFAYPYAAAVNVAGPVSGMEYPGLLFDGMKAGDKVLFWVTAHEIGHTWFPMIVGTNERRDAWLDEGLNTFIDIFESDDFQNGVYGPKRDSEYAPGGGNPVDEILPLLADANAPLIVARADAVSETYRHPVSYFKAALGLVLLREQILGPERFDWAFRKFIRDWAYRHPSPSDFFRTMESAGGEDLAWFWRGWFLHNWSLDLAVADVSEFDDDTGQGARVTIANLDRFVMPCIVQVNYTDGSSERMKIAADAWIQKKKITLKLRGNRAVSSVTLDPDHLIPDSERGNNVYEVTGSPGH